MFVVATQPIDTHPLDQLLFLLTYLTSACLIVYSLGWFDE